MGIQPEKRGAGKNDMRESVFPETDLIFLFLGLLIYLLICIEMNRESCGGQHPDFYQNQVLYIKNLRGFTSLLAMRPADILRPFLSDNQKTYFFQACFFLNQAPPSEGTR